MNPHLPPASLHCLCTHTHTSDACNASASINGLLMAVRVCMLAIVFCMASVLCCCWGAQTLIVRIRQHRCVCMNEVRSSFGVCSLIIICVDAKANRAD